MVDDDEAPPQSEAAPSPAEEDGERPGRTTWDSKWWVAPTTDHALLDSCHDHNVWDIPNGQVDATWQKVLKDFDQDGRVPSICHRLLKRPTAQIRMNTLLNEFERNNCCAERQTGFGDEAYTAFEQLLVTCAQLRNDGLLRKAEKRGETQELDKLKSLGEELRRKAFGSRKRKTPEKGAAGEGAEAEDAGAAPEGRGTKETPNKSPMNPRVLGAKALNILEGSADRKVQQLEYQNKKLQEKADSRVHKEEMERR